jgi:hypothetical protein
MKTTTIRGAALAALAALALSVAACGSSDNGSGGSATVAAAGGATTAPAEGAPTAPADGGPSPADRERLTACLREQGVELPERPAAGGGPPAGDRPPAGGPGGPGGGFGRDLSDAERRKMAAAFETCGARFGMRGGPGGPGGPGRGGRPSTAALRRYVACVRRNGYDLPDPNTSGDGPVFDDDAVDRDDPAFVKASRSCESLLRPSS